MNKSVKDALTLTLITVISGLALGAVHEVTLAPIAKANQNTINEAYKNVFSDAKKFDEYKDFNEKKANAVVSKAGYKGVTINDCVVASDASGKALGYVIAVTNSNDYGGDVTFYMGVKNDGTMNGYSITDISDTPGLGMKATEEKFMSEFKGIKADKTYQVSKSGGGDGKIEAISGATITSTAMTNGVNAGFAYFNSINGGEAK